jgi:hypothetical protein
MTEKRTQLDRIVEILERDGQIDNFFAIHNRISQRLGARIWDLRQQGWEFETIEQPNKNTVYRVVRAPAPKRPAIL